MFVDKMMLEKSTLYSFSGSFLFHVAFAFVAGNYIFTDSPPPPPKKVYRLEVIKKKPPVEKKKIEVKKKLKRKIPKPLKPIKQPKAVMKQEPVLMTKVMPQIVPQVRPKMTEPIPENVTPVTTAYTSRPMLAKNVTSAPRRVQPVYQTTSVASGPVSNFETRAAAAPVAFTPHQAIQSAVTTNTAPAARASSFSSRSAKRAVVASVVPLSRSSSAPTTTNSGRSSLATASRGRRVAIPQAAPQKIGKLEEKKGPGKIALVDTRRARAVSIPNNAPAAPKAFSAPSSDGVRTAYFESVGQRILVASLDPRAIPNFTDEGALRSYKSRLGRIIARSKKYPNLSRSKREEGQVVVRFNILRNGEIDKLVWLTKSPYDRLNQEALNAVRRSAPFAKLPTEIPGEYLEIELPFKFQLN